MKLLSLRHSFHRFLCAVALVASGALPNLAAAQIVAGADVTYANRYVWRGITRASVPVFQPDIYLAYRHSNSFLTLGGWWSFETRSGEDEISDTGSGVGGLGESDYWIELSTVAGPLDLAVGYTAYVFGSGSERRRSSEHDTGELHAVIWWETAALIPRLAVWYDVGAIDGAYIETSVDLRVPILPMASMYIRALAGWSAGQGVSDSDPSRLANFAADGLTHVDFSVWGSYRIGKGLSLAPALHVQVNEDAATRSTNANDSRDVKVWFTVALSWSRDLGGGR